MNFQMLFLFLTSIFLLLSLSFQKEFNPIPEGNGKLNSIYSHQNETNLFFIFLNFRHGARSPIFLINRTTDMIGGNWLLNGELTNLGKKQHFKIGLKNRERYANFISDEYDPKEVVIYSTYFNRTINSVQSQLMGFYNNVSYFNFNYIDIDDNGLEDINDIIPPINLFFDNKQIGIYENSYDVKYEKTYRNHFDCVYLRKQIIKNKKESNEIIDSIHNDFLKEYYDFLIKEFEFINKENIKTIQGFDHFCDVYISVYYDENNKHILNKFKENGKNATKLREICDNYLFNHFVHIRNGGHAINNAIISISPIIKRIINWMEVRINKNNNFSSDYDEPKFVLFSGHDSTLFEMQHLLKNAFNIDFEYTEFASTQLFEIRKYGDLFYVEVYYNDRLKMNITYDEFKKGIENNVMSDKEIYDICYKAEKELKIFFIIISLIIIVVILLIVFIFIIRKINKERKELNYQKVIQIVQ